VTQQNAAMVEESTAASHALASEAEDLGRLVGQFRIGELAPHIPSAPAKRAHAAPARAVPKPPAGKFVAVPRQAAAASAGDWDEF
jgi:methyl-accepting chemotaxis protein